MGDRKLYRRLVKLAASGPELGKHLDPILKRYKQAAWWDTREREESARNVATTAMSMSRAISSENYHSTPGCYQGHCGSFWKH